MRPKECAFCFERMLFSLFYLLRLNRVRYKCKRLVNKKTRIKRINTNLFMTVNKQAQYIDEKIREIRASI